MIHFSFKESHSTPQCRSLSREEKIKNKKKNKIEKGASHVHRPKCQTSTWIRPHRPPTLQFMYMAPLVVARGYGFDNTLWSLVRVKELTLSERLQTYEDDFRNVTITGNKRPKKSLDHDSFSLYARNATNQINCFYLVGARIEIVVRVFWRKSPNNCK